jgi:hypothetical protein
MAYPGVGNFHIEILYVCNFIPGCENFIMVANCFVYCIELGMNFHTRVQNYIPTYQNIKLHNMVQAMNNGPQLNVCLGAKFHFKISTPPPPLPHYLHM